MIMVMAKEYEIMVKFIGVLLILVGSFLIVWDIISKHNKLPIVAPKTTIVLSLIALIVIFAWGLQMLFTLVSTLITVV